MKCVTGSPAKVFSPTRQTVSPISSLFLLLFFPPALNTPDCFDYFDYLIIFPHKADCSPAKAEYSWLPFHPSPVSWWLCCALIRKSWPLSWKCVTFFWKWRLTKSYRLFWKRGQLFQTEYKFLLRYFGTLFVFFLLEFYQGLK